MTKKTSRLAEFRDFLKLNQTDIAQKIGIHQRNWSRYENGDVSTPNSVLIQLSKLGLNLHWYHTGIGNMIFQEETTSSLLGDQLKPPKRQQDDLALHSSKAESCKNSLLLTKIDNQKAEKTAFVTERQTDEKMASQPFDEQNGQENGCQVNLSYQNSKSSKKQETLPFAGQNGQPKSKEPNLSAANASRKQDRNLTYYPEQPDFSDPGPDSGAPNYHTPLPVVHEAADGVVIPLLEQAVSAGRGKELREDDRPALYLNIPSEYGKYGALYALPVRGDSMYPTLDEGDLVVCDSGGWDGDGIYVIKSQDCAFVKRVALSSKGYTVISDNAAYPAYSESKEDIAIVGKVRCAVVRFK